MNDDRPIAAPARRISTGIRGRCGSGYFVICNKKGLHARASAKFVQTVEKFDADVRVKRCGENETVGGTSIMGLMMLAAAPGTSISVEATGRQAAEVVAALATLIETRFGEAD